MYVNMHNISSSSVGADGAEHYSSTELTLIKIEIQHYRKWEISRFHEEITRTIQFIICS